MPAAKLSPAPYESTISRSGATAVKGPPGRAQPPRPPEVVTTSRGSGSSSPGVYRSASYFELPRRRRQDARAARLHERVDVAGDEEDGVHAGELVPRQAVVVAARPELRPHGRDRPLPAGVDVRERPALGTFLGRGVDDDSTRLELLARPVAELVVPERGEEVRFVGEQGELHGGHAAPSAHLLPLVARVRDLARGRHALDLRCWQQAEWTIRALGRPVDKILASESQAG